MCVCGGGGGGGGGGEVGIKYHGLGSLPPTPRKPDRTLLERFYSF